MCLIAASTRILPAHFLTCFAAADQQLSAEFVGDSMS
jgi:hypothetical protein